ncbi:MAG: undecaprenyl-diphosphate phosphatase [Chitinophagaceae bacterium]
MDLIKAIIIAIVEGLTEFLPISSTAHMKITNPIIGVQNSAFTELFEVVIQLAAILSVVTIYFKKFIDFKKLSFYYKLAIAVVPALVAGALLKKHIDAALGNLWFISAVMIAGGLVLLFIDKVFSKPIIHEEKDLSYGKAFIIGCFQVLSIIFPGLSRSASTIIGGMSQKLTKSLAAEFSFFLAVPTMFAASAKSFLDVYKDAPEVLVKENFVTLGVGAIVSYFVALAAIKFFISYVQKNGFKIFGWYRIIVGLAVMICLYMGWINNS